MRKATNMANKEHQRLIMQGVNQWNTWRRENHGLNLVPDLSNIDLYNIDLRAADFAFTNLTGSKLVFANLGGANFVGANLTNANLHRGNLIDANLTKANLTNANLTEAVLVEALLKETDFMDAVMEHTVLANLDLRGCKNLNTVQHKEPSSLSIDTIVKSKGAIPLEFLRGVGLDENFIAFLGSLGYL